MTVVDKLKGYKEENISLDRLLETKVNILAIYGFPDMSIIEAARKIDAVILTDDISLGQYANSCRIANVSFSAVSANNLLTAVA